MIEMKKVYRQWTHKWWWYLTWPFGW